MNLKTEKILSFASLLHTFERTNRSVRVPGTDRLENDAEHSYLLGAMAWYLIDTLSLLLDKSKAIEYALAHDLLEAYAGDTPAFGKGGENGDNRISKAEREAAAIQKIKDNFPEFDSLHASIQRYEDQVDEESKFIFALDKLLPVIGGFAQDGRDWRENKITYDEVHSYKIDKIKEHPQVYEIFEELMATMEKEKNRYFSS